VVSAAPPPERFVAQRARMVVSSDAPQTRTVPEGRSERRAQGAHGYFPANIAKNAGTVPGYSTSKISNHHSAITNPPLAPPRVSAGA